MDCGMSRPPKIGMRGKLCSASWSVSGMSRPPKDWGDQTGSASLRRFSGRSVFVSTILTREL